MPVLTQFDDPTYLEAVYAALFAQLKTAVFAGGVTLTTTLRVSVSPDDVPVAMQPALYQVPGPMHVEQKSVMGPTKWVMTAMAIVFVRADGAAAATGQQVPLPATVVNYLVWGLTQALAGTGNADKQTLGGLVENCWVEGEITPSVEGEQIVFGIPILVLPGPVA